SDVRHGLGTPIESARDICLHEPVLCVSQTRLDTRRRRERAARIGLACAGLGALLAFDGDSWPNLPEKYMITRPLVLLVLALFLFASACASSGGGDDDANNGDTDTTDGSDQGDMIGPPPGGDGSPELARIGNRRAPIGKQ